MESMIIQQMAANGPLMLIFGYATYRLDKRITVMELTLKAMTDRLKIIEEFYTAKKG